MHDRKFQTSCRALGMLSDDVEFFSNNFSYFGAKILKYKNVSSPVKQEHPSQNVMYNIQVSDSQHRYSLQYQHYPQDPLHNSPGNAMGYAPKGNYPQAMVMTPPSSSNVTSNVPSPQNVNANQANGTTNFAQTYI